MKIIFKKLKLILEEIFSFKIYFFNKSFFTTGKHNRENDEYK